MRVCAGDVPCFPPQIRSDCRPPLLRVALSRWRRSLLLLFCTALVAPAPGQILPNPQPAAMPPDLPMETLLWEAEQMAQPIASAEWGGSDALLEPLLIAWMQDKGLEVTAGRAVHLEIVGPNGGVPLPEETFDDRAVAAEVRQIRAAVQAVGGEAPYDWMRRVDAWVPVDELTALAAMLPPGYDLRRSDPPGLDDVMGEGPAAIQSEIYRDAGANGAGVTLAVIDVQYDNYNAARGNGDVPMAATIVNYPGGAFGGAGMMRHGTGCVEAAFDHAPGAAWRVYRLGNLTHLGNAVNNLIAAGGGPKVISHSMSWYNTGWADDSGAACAAARQAATNGILFFTSAGNRAQSHYQAVFAPGMGPLPDWHQFSPGGDETCNIRVPNGRRVTVHLQWDNADGVTDYDLYLYDDAVMVELAKSTNMGAARFEKLTWLNNTGADVNTHLGVRRMAGNAREFELFESTAPPGMQYLTPESSTASPTNTNHLNVVAVGAVRHGDFNAMPGANVIRPYSSRGPTNGRRDPNGVIRRLTAPDLCGPTDTTGFSYPGGFGGTSCATPNAAGAVAALWSADPAVFHRTIRDAVYEWPPRYRDWGPMGRENTYGRGGIILPEVRLDIMPGQDPNPIYLSRNYTIYVVAMASETFAVNELNNRTARFGPTLATAVAQPVVGPPLEYDFDGDGRMDKMYGFRTFECGFTIRDQRGVFKGHFTNGAPLAVHDSVAPVP